MQRLQGRAGKQDEPEEEESSRHQLRFLLRGQIGRAAFGRVVKREVICQDQGRG